MLITLRDMLNYRYLPVVLAILASLLTVPSLWAGLSNDDLMHRQLLLDSATTLTTALRELFTFIEPDTTVQFMDQGVLPWWTLDEARISFFRPVTALTHWLDYQLWPDSFVLMHAQSVVWYGGVGALVALFYRRFFGPVWVAGLAALLFVVDDSHVTPVTWLANRNALLAVFFGLLALLAHDRWRRGGWPVTCR
ncbi:MAG: hypothetical protein IH888_09895 [Planctomycetes bacterium]|nr:hypothetical protein [Planctomycetota bacterium]